jgi:hypothetical protein
LELLILCLLLLLLVSEAILLLLVTLVARVISIGIVVLVGGVELLPLGAVGNEVGAVTALEATPGCYTPLLVDLYKARNFPASKAISSSGMLSYYSSEAAAKEDRANSKANETALVGLAS